MNCKSLQSKVILLQLTYQFYITQICYHNYSGFVKGDFHQSVTISDFQMFIKLLTILDGDCEFPSKLE